MTKVREIKKGFNINLTGKANKKVGDFIYSELVAIKPSDFVHVSRPKLEVNVGDKVKAGQSLFYDNLTPEVKYTSPVSGEVVEIVRGEKRKLLAVKILADREVAYKEYKKHTVSDVANISRADAQAIMCEAGVWPNIIQRPFAIVANPSDTPKSIFVSGFDLAPLGVDYTVILKDQEQYFQAGIDILKKFTKGNINLCLNTDEEVASVFERAKNVTLHKFSGKYPASNVGVQIHHIDPVSKGHIVWTANPVGVAQIGKLFLEGKYDASKVVALAGSEIKEPQYFKVMNGSSVKSLVNGKIKTDNVRYVSGNPLTGENVGLDGFLGYYHNQISVLPEGNHSEFFGWILPSSKKLSFHRALGLFSFMNGKDKEYVIDTNLKGEERAFVQTGTFEKVMPMDIYPTYLIKSILANDFEEMEALGIYEVAEEDFALCEFVDVSKNPIQSIIREGIETLRNS